MVFICYELGPKHLPIEKTDPFELKGDFLGQEHSHYKTKGLLSLSNLGIRVHTLYIVRDLYWGTF